MRIMMDRPSEGLGGILDVGQLLCGWWSVDALYDERGGQLTSDKSGAWGGTGWEMKGAGVEEDGWVRTEIIVLGMWEGEKERTRGLYRTSSVNRRTGPREDQAGTCALDLLDRPRVQLPVPKEPLSLSRPI